MLGNHAGITTFRWNPCLLDGYVEIFVRQKAYLGFIQMIRHRDGWLLIFTGAREDGSSGGWGREMDMGTIKYIVKVVSSTL